MRALLALLLALLVSPASAGPAAGDSRPWLGIGIADHKYGVLVRSIYRGEPADLADIRAGDVIVSIDGERLPNHLALQRLIQLRRHVGDSIEVRLLRDERILRVRVELGRYPSREEIFKLLRVDLPAPDLSLPVLVGTGGGGLDAYRGDVAVVAFASGDCPGCEELWGELTALVNGRGDEGLVVLWVTGDPSLTQGVSRLPPRFSLLHDFGHRARRDWLEGAVESPVVFVVDRDGIVRWAGNERNEMHAAASRALLERNGIDLGAGLGDGY